MHIIHKALPYFVIGIGVLAAYACQRSSRIEVKKEKIGDVDLAHYIRGNGDPLIMIMGFRGTMAVWDPALLEQLEKHYTLILFDNRGVGLSTDNESEPLTISQMAKDTVGLIKALGYQKTHILGWSMGSRIAMEIAINFPEVVDTLILCSPNPGGKYQAERSSNAYQKLSAVDLPQDEALSLIFPQTVKGTKAAASFIARLTKAIILGDVPNDINVSPSIIERQAEALIHWDENSTVYEQLANIKVPSLITGGLSDSLDPSANIRIVGSRIPFAWTAYFAGAGHAFISQEHEKFAELVNVFIESSKPTRN